MAVNSVLWTLYGLSIKSKPIWSCNSIGIFLGLAYIGMFVSKSGGLSSKSGYLPVSAAPPSQTIFSRKDLPSNFQSHVVLSLLILSLGLHFFRTSFSSGIAIMANLVCAVMFMSPLSSLQKIIQQKRCPKGAIPLPFTATQVRECVVSDKSWESC